MQAVDDLHGLKGSPANAVGVEVAALAADDDDGRRLGQPGRDRRGGAVRQQVYDAMRHEIDEDGAIAVAPPPGPLINADGLQGWGVGHWGLPYQPEEGRRTGRQPQASREPGPCVPAEGDGKRAEGRDEPRRFARLRGDELWQAFCEDATRTARIPADAFPHHQVDPNGKRAPGEVRHVAPIAAMHRG
jgi:hypothetical protein